MVVQKRGTTMKKGILGAVKRLGREVRQYKKDALLSPAFTTLCVILEIYIPYLTASIIDDGIAVGNMPHVAKIGVVMIVMALLAALCGVKAGTHASRASTGFACNLRETMFDKIQSYSFKNIDKFSTAGLVTRMTTDVSHVQMSFQMIMMMCTRAPMTMVVALVMAISISPRLSMIFLAVMVLLISLLLLLVPMAMKYFKRMFKKYDALNAVIKENVGAIRVVKAFVREKHENEKFAKAAGDVYENSIAAEKIMSLNNPIMMTCVRTCTLLISWFGAKMIVSGTGLTTGELTSLLSYTMNILFSLMMLSMVYVMITQSAAAVERIDEVLTEEPDIVSPEKAVKTVADGRIDFDNVSFSYGGKDGKRVLENVNLHIASGETIGIIGGTGSSKSTLVSLISRLYDATEGEVRVGGVNVRDYDVDALRGEVSVVLQKNVLFSGTVIENLRWGNPDATQEECREACRMACADEFVSAMPEGYNTKIERGGTNVSGGQKQRLCIARALLARPKVLILDDSTSAVDTATDAKIRAAMKAAIPGTTKIIIAQRIASVEDADRVLVLDDGKISGFDTPDNLMEKNAIYREVATSQAGNGSGDFDEAAMKDKKGGER